MSSAVKKTHHAESRRSPGARARGTPVAFQRVAVTSAAKIEWNYVVACEARNALQVVLSGGEILLDDQFGALSSEQRKIIAKMMDNACHLNRLIATLRETAHATLPEPATIARSVGSYIGPSHT